MITREDYLNALELIDLYHQQLNLSDVRHSSSSVKTSIVKWMEENNIPKRIQSVLTGHGGRYGTSFKYIEDITEIEWCKHYLGSKENYKVFTELRKSTLNYA